MREETWQSGAASGKYCVHGKVVFSGTQNLRRWWGSDCCLLSLKYLKNRNQVGKEGWKNSLLYYMKQFSWEMPGKYFCEAQELSDWLLLAPSASCLHGFENQSSLDLRAPHLKRWGHWWVCKSYSPLKKDELKTSSHLQSQFYSSAAKTLTSSVTWTARILISKHKRELINRHKRDTPSMLLSFSVINRTELCRAFCLKENSKL